MTGIVAVWLMVLDYNRQALEKQRWDAKRAEQNSHWLDKLLHDMLELKLNSNPEIKSLRPQLAKQVVNGETTAFLAARKLIELL
jgi:LAO/AO transport system kinase